MKRTYQPKKRQEQKEHGFMKRMKTKSGIYMYLLNSAGRVNEKITLEDRESLIINTNYAMNTAKFSYNPKRHSLLYLTRKDDFIVEEYDIKKRKIIKTYPLSYSIINPKG